MSADPRATAVADQFVRNLVSALTPGEYAEVLRRNATPEYQTEPPVCASHDFIDANECMADAMRLAGGFEFLPAEEEDAAGHEAYCRLWGDAWASAKARHLTAKGEAS